MTPSPATLAALARISTATLTTLLFKRGLRNVFLQGVQPLNRDGRQLVGPAYTLRYIPAREDLDHLGVFRDRTHPQRRAVEEVPPGAVLVMDCRGDASAASAGSILVTRMMVRGVAGLVTDAGLRDSPEIARMDFPAYCRGPSAPLNLVKHHAVDANVPIACGGVAVYPGDIVVGDGEGVVIVPAELADEIAGEAGAQEQFETFVLEQVRAGRSTFGLYPPTDPGVDEEFKAWAARQSTTRED